MKAVIMAGGEGTRLRPQTSNLPKPMLPLVGRPMMEHIVSLLRRHGITDIVVTVAFLPNVIRSYFGDGSELGVRMVYATEESPLGTAGSVRNARDELTERFLVISGDVLTDIDLTSVIEFHEKNQALATIALSAGGEPARVRDRDHPRGRQHRAVLGEARLGPGLQRHHQHRHLRARARDLRAHPRGSGGRLLERGLPGRARGGPAPLRLRGRRLLGGRRHHGGLSEGPRGHPRGQGGCRGVRLRAATGRLAGQEHVDRPLGHHRVAGLHRRQLHHRSGRRRGRLHDDGGQHPGGRAGRAAPLGDRGELLHRPGRPGGGGRAGALLRPAPRGPGRPRCGGGGGLPHRQPRRGAHRRQGLPLQGGRGRGAGQRVHRLGVGRGPHPLRSRRRAGDRQRRHQPRARRAPGQGVGLELREGLVHHGLARHQPHRPRCSSGRSWSAATRSA